MPGALRRLSVALRLTEAYTPAYTSVIPTNAASLSLFLRNAKDGFLKDVKEDRAKAAKWTVVMGNEAGDLDSIASSIAYAWIQSEVHKKPAVPLIQMAREDLALRAENLYALQLAGVSQTHEELLTLSEVSSFAPFPAQKFVLVDHNRLGDTYTLNNPGAEVVAVVDHHQDEGLYPSANPRVIAPCGSCSSHVAALLPRDIPAQIATLLLTAIVIDTDGFKPDGKATQVDRDAGVIVATQSTMANSLPPLSALAPIDQPNPYGLYDAQAIKDLTKTLTQKKTDVSRLSPLDLLRRDYKEYTHPLSWAQGTPTIKVGLSTVPLGLKSWATDGKLEKDALVWMQRRGLTILGVLTSFRDVKKNILGSDSGKGKHKREMAWIVLEEPLRAAAGSARDALTSSALAKRLWAGLEDSKDINVERSKMLGDLEKGSKLPHGSKARVYTQENTNATRKVVAPLVKDILEESPSEGKGKKTVKKH